MCPRRFWMEMAQDEAAGTPAFLSASGTDQDDKLANPVYLEKEATVVVWVAPLEDNRGYFRQGQRINPDILNPGFDTKYISCALYPYSLKESESGLYQSGVYKEGDQLELASFEINQLDIAGTTLPLGGFAKKVTLVSKHAFALPDEDLLVPGT